MGNTVKRIAVVQGASGAVVQQLFRDFVQRWGRSVRIAGLVEEARTTGNRPCGAGQLRSIVSGHAYPIFQELGPGSTACDLDGAAAVPASDTVAGDIARGCDLVVLSKFGKLEAEERRGLIPAFAAAIEADVPILTFVSPKFDDAWARFAAPLFVVLPAEADAIDRWWRALAESESAPTRQVPDERSGSVLTGVSPAQTPADRD